MGFFEILIIAVVTLLVVGPDRMPEAVRTIALTLGRIKRSFNAARDEIEKQIGADDIRRQLHNEEVMASLGKMNGEMSLMDKNSDTDEQQHELINPRHTEEQMSEKHIETQEHQPAEKSPN